MLRLIEAELFKLRKRALTWILLYILIALLVVLYLILFAISRLTLPSMGGGGPPTGLLSNLLGLRAAIPFAFAMLTFFGAALSVILMGSSVGNEFNWRTIRIALISSESRFKFLAAKLISVIILILIGMLIGVATGILMSIITTAIAGNSFSFSFLTGSYAWNQFVHFWRTFFVIMPFTLTAFFFAVFGRSAMAGIAVGIGIGFLEPIMTGLMRLAGGWVAKIPDYLFTANINAIAAQGGLPAGITTGGPPGFSQAVPSAPHAYLVLGVYMLAFLVIGFFLFRKRDVTG